jgi:hypothetical protein
VLGSVSRDSDLSSLSSPLHQIYTLYDGKRSSRLDLSEKSPAGARAHSAKIQENVVIGKDKDCELK